MGMPVKDVHAGCNILCCDTDGQLPPSVALPTILAGAVEQRDKNYATPLKVAKKAGQAAMVELLLKHGAKVGCSFLASFLSPSLESLAYELVARCCGSFHLLSRVRAGYPDT